MPTARERQVCQQQYCPRKSVSVDNGLINNNNVNEIAAEVVSRCDCCSVNRNNSSSETVIVASRQLCSAAVQCSFCRWKRIRRSVLEGGEGASDRRGGEEGIHPPGMDSEEEWCGRLIRDQHGLYGKLTPVFREHFNNRQQKGEQQQSRDSAILDSTFAGDAREVAMETVEAGATGEQQQRNVMMAAAQLSGMSLAERRLAVAPRITLTSVDGDDEARQQQQQQRSLSSGGDGLPCRSAGLDSAGGHGSPLSPNFLSVPQLQEVGKERRPAPMVV